MPAMPLNRATRALIATMESAGVTVRVADRDGAVTATARTPNGHIHVVTGDDAYKAVSLAAERCGLELKDG